MYYLNAFTTLGLYLTADKTLEIVQTVAPMAWSVIFLLFIRTLTEIYKCRIHSEILKLKHAKLLITND